jgi:amino acid transporter
MLSKLKEFSGSMKRYERVILVEAIVYLAIMLAFRLYIHFSGHSSAVWQILGTLVITLIVIIYTLVMWALPAFLARKCEEEGQTKYFKIIKVMTIMCLGILGILVYVWMLLDRYLSRPSPNYSPYELPSFSMSKKCGSCGKPAPDSAKVGDVCSYCGARWGYENTTYINR